MFNKWSWVGGLVAPARSAGKALAPTGKRPARQSAAARLDGNWDLPLDGGGVPLKVLAAYVDPPGEERGYALARFFPRECRRTVVLRGAGGKETRLSLPALPCAYPTDIDQVMAATRKELQQLIDHPPGTGGRLPAQAAPERQLPGQRADAESSPASAVTQRHGPETEEAQPQPAPRPREAPADAGQSTARQAAGRPKLELVDSEPKRARAERPESGRTARRDAGEVTEWTGEVVFYGWKPRSFRDEPARPVYLISLLDDKTGEVIEKKGIHLKELVHENGIQVGDRIWLKLKEVKKTVDHRTDESGGDVQYTKRANVYDLKKLPPHD